MGERQPPILLKPLLLWPGNARPPKNHQGPLPSLDCSCSLGLGGPFWLKVFPYLANSAQADTSISLLPTSRDILTLCLAVVPLLPLSITVLLPLCPWAAEHTERNDMAWGGAMVTVSCAPDVARGPLCKPNPPVLPTPVYGNFSAWNLTSPNSFCFHPTASPSV